MNFIKGTTVLAESASRALGGVIGKTKTLRNMGFSTYTKLYQSCVCPVLDYVAGVWGFKNYPAIETIHNRAIRYYLGVHKFAPTLAISGDMGWESCEGRRSLCMLRLWNRLIGMDENRLTKRVFYWDLHNNGIWTRELTELCNKLRWEEVPCSMTNVDLNLAREIISLNNDQNWNSGLQNKPKLRTYRQIKTEFGLENYVRYYLSKKKRSLCAQFRTGILPLHIETGRWAGTREEDRLCPVCDLEEMENEIHFIFYCPFYNELRIEMFGQIKLSHFMEDNMLLAWLFEHKTMAVANFIDRAWEKRRTAMYQL